MLPSNTTAAAATSTTDIRIITSPSSSKWTVMVSLDSRKRTIPPPTSDNYKDWSLDQLKLECTARSLNVAKNTRKDERVKVLSAWDANMEGLEALLSLQRKKTKRGRGEDDKRTKGCMFRLLNVLFSIRFYVLFVSIGNQLRREEIDQGGSTFWMDVAAAFGSDTGEFDRIISDDAVFQDVDASYKMGHSAAKLKRMWKEVSSNFARAEAGSKVSGQGSHDFWDFCDDRADVYYLDRRCEHRQGAREFCSANVYPEDEDDSTLEGEEGCQQVNRKRRWGSQSGSVTSLLERVNDLPDKETSESCKAQEETWNEQKMLIQVQRASQNLSTLYAMLDRNETCIQQLFEQRQEYISRGLDAAEIGQMLEARLAKRTMLEVQISQLELKILNGMR
ncbi:hypothetical protein PF005_g2304 [Phytophthora fragariae]|uniref:Uncharacterized protein n=2 Tax=Phytophthora fragariae TaxID=53985 RepID=A0A6A3URV1_9STRA|nr:hypothetical protein PF003_g13480 [Phytophthora fragariae]KAE8942047.1 hypothetical protein PF009_g8186 [Phytophthora fragariae]KAE9136173.1 hypothetical protein PF007_g2284 [Phytophthora fragariae]KAE9154036.1 hypothetical protein PF006_g1890 [Phytophthora fragariae]KAE9233470.1 hypothetical protein PF005_g2304 [Phytophthora fragariae]